MGVQWRDFKICSRMGLDVASDTQTLRQHLWSSAHPSGHGRVPHQYSSTRSTLVA